MEEISKLIESKISDAISQIDFQEVFLKNIEKSESYPLLDSYLKELDMLTRKQHSINLLRENALLSLKKDPTNARKYIILDKTVTRTYLKNKYAIIDFTQDIEILKEEEIDLSVTFGYEKTNPFFSKIQTIISDLQENIRKTQAFDINSIDDDFHLSDRFYKPFCMSVIVMGNEIIPLSTVIRQVEYKDPNTGEVLPGIKIEVEKVTYPKGTIIRLLESFSLPNSIFTTDPFPDTMEFLTPAAYTKIRVQEEIYGNTNKILSPVLTEGEGKKSKICPLLGDGVSLYYYYHEWEFLYNPKRKDLFKVTVKRKGMRDHSTT